MRHLIVQQSAYVHMLEGFGEWLEVLGYASTTVYQAPLCVQEFLHYVEQQNITNLHVVNEGLTDAYFTYLSRRPNERRGGSLSASHINKHRQALRVFSKYLHQVHGINIRVRAAQLQPQPARPEVLTRKEIELLYQAADYHAVLRYRDKLMLDLYYGCGLRRSEGTALLVRDVDLRRHQLLVRNSKNGRGRMLPFTDKIAQHLRGVSGLAAPLFGPPAVAGVTD